MFGATSTALRKALHMQVSKLSLVQHVWLQGQGFAWHGHVQCCSTQQHMHESSHVTSAAWLLVKPKAYCCGLGISILFKTIFTMKNTTMNSYCQSVYQASFRELVY